MNEGISPKGFLGEAVIFGIKVFENEPEILLKLDFGVISELLRLFLLHFLRPERLVTHWRFVVHAF